MPRFLVRVVCATILALLFVAANTPAAVASTSRPTASLAELEAQARQGADPSSDAFVQRVARLIESEALKKPDHFFRASQLLTGPATDVWVQQMKYELLLAAAAKQHKEAEQSLAAAWDGLLYALQRPLRTEAGLNRFDAATAELTVQPAPESIQAVLRDPAAARAAAKKAKPNLEVFTLADAHGEAMTERARRPNLDRQNQLMAETETRAHRIISIAATGQLRTGSDFTSAARIFAGSSPTLHRELAHELALCAMLLGERMSTRQVAFTYDLFLVSLKLKRRFGSSAPNTQSNLDSAGISRAQREILQPPPAGKLPPPRPREPTVAELAQESERLADAGKLADAEAVEWRLLATARTRYSENPALVASYTLRLAQTLNRRGKFTDAEPLARERSSCIQKSPASILLPSPSPTAHWERV